MKKLTALVIAFAALFSFASVVYADEVPEVANSETITINVDEAPEEVDEENVSEEIIEVFEEKNLSEGTNDASEEVIEISEDASSEEILSSKRLVLYVNVVKPEGEIIPGNMLINIFSEDGVWLSNNVQMIDKEGEYVYEFSLPEYKVGTKFKVYLSDGAEYIEYGTTKCYKHQCFTYEAVTAYDIQGQPYISDAGGITAHPWHTEMWEHKAEMFVNEQGITSETPFMIWVSKKNYTVSVFMTDGSGNWDCINYFGCSIGAPDSPTVTGEYKYHQYQERWDYGTYYVGPVMRFYRGYAIHSTLVKYDGTDYDGRIGKMISHGCVRVRPENMDWLVKSIPMNTTIYVTND